MIGLMGIGGLIWAAVQRQWWAFAILAFFLPYYVLIGRAEVKFLRYTFPLYVGIAAGFGYVISETQRRESWKRTGVVLGILAIGGIDTGGLRGAGRATAWMAMEDPRDSAARLLKKEGAKTVGYTRDPWTWSVPVFKDATLPRMPMGPAYIGAIIKFAEQVGVPPSNSKVPFYARMTFMEAARDPAAVFFYQPKANAGLINPSDLQMKDFDERLVTELRPEYVTLTSLEAGPLEWLRNPSITDEETRNAVLQYKLFIGRLEADYARVATFGAPAPSVEDMQYVQPTVHVWKRKTPGL
jgi:hypothetical protein